MGKQRILDFENDTELDSDLDTELDSGFEEDLDERDGSANGPLDR